LNLSKNTNDFNRSKKSLWSSVRCACSVTRAIGRIHIASDSFCDVMRTMQHATSGVQRARRNTTMVQFDLEKAPKRVPGVGKVSTEVASRVNAAK
jgi:hypothetical protein